MRSSTGEAVVVTHTDSSAPISARKLPAANSRSGSAPSATLTLPKWKWPSSMASTSWLRWRRSALRHGAAGELAELLHEGVGGGQAGEAVEQREGHAAARLQRLGRRPHLLADGQRVGRAAEFLQGLPAACRRSWCPASRRACGRRASRTRRARTPAAGRRPRSARAALRCRPGVRWLPGSTLTRCARRGVSVARDLPDQRRRPPWPSRPGRRPA